MTEELEINPELVPLDIVLEYRPFEVEDSITNPCKNVVLEEDDVLVSCTATIKHIIPENPQDSIVFWFEGKDFSISGAFQDVFLDKSIRYKTYIFTTDREYVSEQSHVTNRFNVVPTRPKESPDSVEIYKYTPDNRREIDFTFTIVYDVLIILENLGQPILYEDLTTTRFITVLQDYSTGRDALLHKLNTGLEPPDIDPVYPGSELV